MDDFPYTVITVDGTFKGRLTEEDVLEVAPEYVVLEPNYEQTLKFLGKALCEGAHEQPYLALWSILDQMRYLVQTDMPAALRVVEYFGKAHENWENNVVHPQVGGEDSHLEADYEDRFQADTDLDEF